MAAETGTEEAGGTRVVIKIEAMDEEITLKEEFLSSHLSLEDTEQTAEPGLDTSPCVLAPENVKQEPLASESAGLNSVSEVAMHTSRAVGDEPRPECVKQHTNKTSARIGKGMLPDIVVERQVDDPPVDDPGMFVEVKLEPVEDDTGAGEGAGGDTKDLCAPDDRPGIREAAASTKARRPHTCPICMKTLQRADALKLHMRTHTGEKPYSCDICNKLFRYSNGLRIHLTLHSGQTPHECPTCGKRYANRDGLRSHETGAHKVRVGPAPEPFQCVICSKTFKRRTQLVLHMRTHTGEKPYTCSLCNKKFTYPKNIKEHMRTHTGEKPYECSTCSKRFTHWNSLQLHERTHTGEKPFQCDICEKGFTNLSNLKKHLFVHSNEKRYACGVCRMEFKHIDNLKRHEPMHDQKSFSCQECQKAFASARHLKNHEYRLHRAVKRHSCVTCDMSFLTSQRLKDHERTHTGEKPFTCNICNKQFALERYLQIHERIHARETNEVKVK